VAEKKVKVKKVIFVEYKIGLGSTKGRHCKRKHIFINGVMKSNKNYLKKVSYHFGG